MNDSDIKEREYIILRTYNSVWKVDKKIYSIDNLKLLVPINTDEMLYIIASVALSAFIFKILPFLNVIPFAIKYGVIPFLIMKFLTKQKLDGKLPHKFFIDYLAFCFSPKQSTRFKSITEYKNVKFVTPIVMRDIEIVNKTEQALKQKNKGLLHLFGRKGGA